VQETEPFDKTTLSNPLDDEIKYNGQLTPSLLYQIHMEYKGHDHRGVDLFISNNIHEVVQHHAENGLDFKSFSILTRQNLLKRVAEVYHLKSLKPKIYKIHV